MVTLRRVRAFHPAHLLARGAIGTAAALASLLVSMGCSSLPRDPEKTLQHVRQRHNIRVRIVENPPWVIHRGSEPAGVVTLAGFGLFILGDSPMKLIAAQHPTVQTVHVFGREIWLGLVDGRRSRIQRGPSGRARPQKD